jgi:hypothetical protein
MDSTKSLNTVQTLRVCKMLQEFKMTPKEFLHEFLTSKDEELASRRRFWATPKGWDSTLTLLATIRNRFMATAKGKAKWESFIVDEVSSIPKILQMTWF